MDSFNVGKSNLVILHPFFKKLVSQWAGFPRPPDFPWLVPRPLLVVPGASQHRDRSRETFKG